MSEWQSDRIEELENELVAAKDYYKSGSDSQVEIINEQTTRIAELEDQLRQEREAHEDCKTGRAFAKMDIDTLRDQLRREREAHGANIKSGIAEADVQELFIAHANSGDPNKMGRPSIYRKLIDFFALRNRAQISQLLATHEREVLEVIDQRDAAEDALSQAYFLVTGRSPEWSNLFGHQHALEDLDDAQKTLRITVAQLQATISQLTEAINVIKLRVEVPGEFQSFIWNVAQAALANITREPKVPHGT